MPKGSWRQPTQADGPCKGLKAEGTWPLEFPSGSMGLYHAGRVGDSCARPVPCSCLWGLVTRLGISLGTSHLQPRGLARGAVWKLRESGALEPDGPNEAPSLSVCLQQAVLRGPKGFSLQVAGLGLHLGGLGPQSLPSPRHPLWDFRVSATKP